MLRRTQHKVGGLFRRNRKQDLNPNDVAEARRYIAGYWPKLERYHPKDENSLIGLPNKYLVPASEETHAFDFNEMYYWDTYFMAQGLLDETHKELLVGMLDNLLAMQQRFGVIPNASRTYLMGRSQPPLLTSFIFDLNNTYDFGVKWVSEKIAVAEEEYKHVWMGTAKPHARRVYDGLSRYYDINMLQDLAETESGWDMTPRFERRILDYLPVDLNSLLYKYETDFAEAARFRGDIQAARSWQQTAGERRDAMNRTMWSNAKGLFYDYNYVKRRRGPVSSLAAYYPMWAGLASTSQAQALVRNLKKFEFSGGLATTEQQFSQLIPAATLPKAIPTQWAYPNGWAPLHFIVVKGLENYGYHDHARRIAMKWLHTNLDWFKSNGQFIEKYNVVNPGKPPGRGLYPMQVGFGWTNAVFEHFCREYLD